jgi:GT2 family glycosyltransferase
MVTDNSRKTVDLSIIIVSWNVRQLLHACLQSIWNGRGDLELEVIVVDGGSKDGSPEMVQSDFPWVRLIARADNVGFPRGNNLGLAGHRSFREHLATTICAAMALIQLLR